MPIAEKLSEAGWEPITKARSDNQSLLVERFEADATTQYITIFNPEPTGKSVTITLDASLPGNGLISATELVTGASVAVSDNAFMLSLASEAVGVIELVFAAGFCSLDAHCDDDDTCTKDRCNLVASKCEFVDLADCGRPTKPQSPHTDAAVRPLAATQTLAGGCAVNGRPSSPLVLIIGLWLLVVTRRPRSIP